MPFFASEAQYQKVKLAWDLMMGGELSAESAQFVNDVLTQYGTDNLRPMLDKDGHAKLPDGWNEVGLQNEPAKGLVDFSLFSSSDLQKAKQNILKELDLDTDAGLRAAGIDETYVGDDGKPIRTNPTQLIDDKGYIRGFNDDGKGHHTISQKDGAQLKIFGQYDTAGKLKGLSVATLSTNNFDADGLDADTEADGTYGKKFEYALKAVKNLAGKNDIAGKDVLFEGYSLGGGATNDFHHLKASLAGGFFKESGFYGFDAPYFSPEDGDGHMYNFGAKNDPVYGAWGYGNKEGHDDFATLLKETSFDKLKIEAILTPDIWDKIYPQAKPLADLVDWLLPNHNSTLRKMITENPQAFDTIKPYVKSGNNNLVVYDDAFDKYGSKSVYNNTIVSRGWGTHGDIPLSDAVERIHDSHFQQEMNRDSVIVLSHLSKENRGKVWVSDKQSLTNDHFGKDAFILGEQGDYTDWLQDGAGNDHLEGGAGDDQYRLSTGNDVVYDTGGTDTVTLEGHASDYTLAKSMTDPYGLTLFSDQYGTKELHGIDKLNFQGDSLSEILHKGSEFNIVNNTITRDAGWSNWFADPKSTRPAYSDATNLLSGGKA